MRHQNDDENGIYTGLLNYYSVRITTITITSYI